MPALAKAGGNYLSSQLISTEAKRLGFAEGIALATDGTISEGAGENLFLVVDGRLLTPPATSSILTGITRDNVTRLKGVWRARLRGSGTAPQYSGFAQPIVAAPRITREVASLNGARATGLSDDLGSSSGSQPRP